MNKEKNIIIYEDGELKLEVPTSLDEQTVWLTQRQMSSLFDTSKDNISLHIKNICEEGELSIMETTEDFSVVQKEGKRNVKRMLTHYNLDMILSVGYRVKSKQATMFRKWSTNIIKNYMLQGYAINERRMHILNKSIQIQSSIIANIAGIDGNDVLKVIKEYSHALELLDDYDHQCVEKPNGNASLYRLSYEECRYLIDKMSFNSDVFGVEKEKGKLNGIIAAVYQEVFGVEIYPSLEEKAANLLYFLIKDHPFTDGCKRIAATLFLEFLNKNGTLYKQNQKVISDSALVAITLMVAESNPKEKDIMVTMIMNFLVHE
ncbi:MAG: virulence protein RhuM/Fic/DOC family protein [Erysipelotrichaceae bacterium]